MVSSVSAREDETVVCAQPRMGGNLLARSFKTTSDDGVRKVKKKRRRGDNKKRSWDADSGVGRRAVVKARTNASNEQRWSTLAVRNQGRGELRRPFMGRLGVSRDRDGRSAPFCLPSRLASG